MFKIPDMSILQVSINFQPNQRKILLKTFERTGGQRWTLKRCETLELSETIL